MSGDVVLLRARPGLRLATALGGIACVGMTWLSLHGAPERRRLAYIWGAAAVLWLGRWLVMLLWPYLELRAGSFTLRNPVPVTIARDTVEAVERRRNLILVQSRSVARLKIRLDHLVGSDRATAAAWFDRLGAEAASRAADEEGESATPGSSDGGAPGSIPG